MRLHLVDGDGRAESVDGFDERADAVAHRIVHGGPHLRRPVLVDDEVHAQLVAASALAPLHNTAALAALEQARRELRGRPHVAVFDTGFHATIPDAAAT